MRHNPFVRVLILALAFAFTSGVSLVVVGPLETWIVSDLSISHSQAGLIQSALFLGNLGGSLLAGWLFYAMGVKTFGAVSLLVFGVGSMLTGLQCYEVMLVGRLMVGLGNAGSMVFFSTLIVQGFRSKQTALLSVYHAPLALGAVLSLVGGRQVGQWAGSWSVPFWIAGAMAFLLAAGTVWSVLPEPGAAERLRLAAVRQIICHPVVLATFVLFAGYIAAEQGVVTFFPAFGEQERQFSAGAAARTAAMYWVGVGLGRLAAAFMTRKAAEQWVMITCTVIGSLLLLCSLFPRQSAGAVVAVFLAGCAIGPIIPVGWSYVVKQVGRLEAAVLSMCGVVSCASGTLAPAISGYVADQHSLFAGLAGSYAVFMISVLPLVWISFRRTSSRATITGEP